MTKNLIQHIEGLEVTQGEGKASAPQSDWNPRRFGANPPVALVNLQSEAALTVLSSRTCGSTSLANPSKN